MKLSENIAYSEMYQKRREDAMEILNEEFFDDEDIFSLSDGYTAIFRNYEKITDGCHLSASRFFLKKE